MAAYVATYNPAMEATHHNWPNHTFLQLNARDRRRYIARWDFMIYMDGLHNAATGLTSGRINGRTHGPQITTLHLASGQYPRIHSQRSLMDRYSKDNRLIRGFIRRNGPLAAPPLQANLVGPINIIVPAPAPLPAVVASAPAQVVAPVPANPTVVAAASLTHANISALAQVLLDATGSDNDDEQSEGQVEDEIDEDEVMED